MPQNGERDAEWVIDEFQKRRNRMLRHFGVSMLLIALSLVLVDLAERFPTILGTGSRMVLAVGVAQFVTGVVFALIGFQQYRCPVCNQIARAHDKFYLGLATNPDHCPNCGARLSD